MKNDEQDQKPSPVRSAYSDLIVVIEQLGENVEGLRHRLGPVLAAENPQVAATEEVKDNMLCEVGEYFKTCKNQVLCVNNIVNDLIDRLEV